MVDSMVSYFVSFFESPSVVGIGLAVGFGAIWLAAYWPPLAKKPGLWVVLAGSALFTLLAICFLQTPLQIWMGQALRPLLRPEIAMRWMLLASIPQILLTGLVQEGAKLVPMVVYWRHSGKNIDPKLGLIIGAVAGAGFAIFEAQWAYNLIFASGWAWASVQGNGFMALLGFWERFFTIAAHVAFSALAGYGLAKGQGWQFYLIASGLHAVLNYSIVLLQVEILSILHAEIYIAGVASAVTAWALWRRWRKEPGMVESAISGS